MNDSFVIGSRGSKLALTQAEWVRAQLSLLNPRSDIRIEIITTTGDVKSDPLSVIGGKGVFTKELEDALFDRRIDIAVHSLKDLPSIIPEGLALAAICEREDPRDALVLPQDSKLLCKSLDDLPAHSILGTSSPRRVAQLKHWRVDLEIRDLRGNVDTRLRKLDEGQYDAVILAAAGLRRLGLKERISLPLPTNQMMPAVGQGAIGVEIRDDDRNVRDVVSRIDHEDTHVACVAERALLRGLGGGCQLPIAGHGVTSEAALTLEGLVVSSDGKYVIQDFLAGSKKDPESMGAELASRLLASGAGDLLKD